MRLAPPRHRRPLPVLLAAPVAALLLLGAACSDDGSDDEGASGTTAPTQATEEEATSSTEAVLDAEAYVEAFSTICLEIDAEIEALPEPESYDDLVELATTAEAAVTDGVTRLRELVAPEEIAEEATTGLDLLAGEAGNFAAVREAATAGDDAAIEAAAAAGQANRDAAEAVLDPLGIDCGFEDEGNGGGTPPAAGEDGPPAGADPDQPTAQDLPPGESASASIPEYGTDAQWTEWSDQCEEGVMVACDALWLETVDGSGWATYGQTCGGRVPPHGPDDYCQQLTFSPGR